MTNDKDPHPPNQPLQTFALTVVKASLSAIPVVGGPAAERFSALVVPPLTKRRDKWVESIAEGLQRLEKTVQALRSSRSEIATCS